MVIKFNLIAAICENNGLAKNGVLPFSLPSELAYYLRITSATKDKTKKNLVIMGRKSWDSLVPEHKPFPDTINFVLSRSELDLSAYKDVYTFKSIEEATKKLEEKEFKKQYEEVWVIGGGHIYEAVYKTKNFYRFYLTRVFQPYDCDTILPPVPENVVRVSDPRTPQGVQEENGIQFIVNVYENKNFKE